MTRKIEEQIAILHPVAGCIRLRTIAEAVRLGKVYTSDVDDAISTLGSQRARALARIVLVVTVGDAGDAATDDAISSAEMIEATRTACEVLGL